ncbi:MAG: hypothetical protein ACI9WU_003337, partial [Myxococcota bacterium]
GDDHGHGHGHAHGPPVAIGVVTVGGYALEAVRQGAFRPGEDTEITLSLATPAPRDIRQGSFYLWVVDAAGLRLGPPQRATAQDGRLQAKLPIEAWGTGPSQLVIRVRDSESDTRAQLSLGTIEAPTKNGGVLATLTSPDGTTGYVELKLHDDKGDLELWLYRDEAGKQPLDIPAKSVLEVTFEARQGKKVTLKVRDHEQNPGEEGEPHMRSGATNYFIFPGDSGQPSKWLADPTFKEKVRVQVPGNKTPLHATLKLVPHTH